MKVFAHYFKSPETGNEYRWRTLLQFGTSWKVIGTIVMKNPGSAAPLKIIEDAETLSHLNAFSSENDWYAFSVDNTMQNIERLFSTYYKNKSGSSTLDGVIQVFNLMNVRDPNLEMALVKNHERAFPFSRTVDKDITQLIAPVYLGWGNLKFNPTFRDDAERLFHTVYEMPDGKYLHANFAENSFYHPQYLMGRGKNRPNSQYLLHAFCQNTTSPSY